ncbi:unnamed protein product, partial [Schistosoma mattheei]|uniref:SSD domain-containing protein n=1 Tax=Schistosoma mattheei TaxID=31246 RepID=A0AA85AUD0_9TREM
MFGIIQIILWIYTIRSKLSNMSTYTKIVFIILTIQLLNTLFIMIIFCYRELMNQLLSSFFISYVIRSLEDSMVRSIVLSVLVFIAVVTALLIAFVKEISDTFPLNVITLFIYTITLATAIEILDILVGMGAKLGAFGISLTLFTSALLIGAAIKTRLADYLTAIVILFIIAAISFAVASILITIFKHSSAAIIFYILTDILLFVITIFVSQITVGKLQLRIFCTEYTLAALFLYNMFSTTYLTTTGMICNITSTCNSSNASIYSFNNLP